MGAEAGSNGYEALATEFMTRRGRGEIGVAIVRAWSRGLTPGASILDLGCGHGLPISQALLDDGFDLHGIDAAPTLVAAFRQRCPDARVVCEAVEHSSFFGRSFDGVIAVGLMFLLAEAVQLAVIDRVASSLRPGGRFLFSAPAQACSWTDVLTERSSRSLGAPAYHARMIAAGLTPVASYVDEGENYYFAAERDP